ncbi:MAG: anti-sigma factor family protein [Candidatus Binatia bacterium]
MNCQEVQLQLSAYLEKSLDAIRMKSIETHLSSCPFCRAEIHRLSDCIRQVAELPMVEPPVGFVQRVMAHAREIEIEPTAWRRLLAALKVTMPIQAAAMVLIGVLAVLLYQKEPRPRNFAFTEMTSEMAPAPTLPSPVEEKANLRVESSPPMAPEPSRLRDTKRENIAPVELAPQSVVQSTPQTAADRTAIKDETTVAESPAVAKSEKALEKSLDARVAAPRRPAIQAQEVSTGSESRRPSADTLGIGAAIGALSRTPFRGAPYSAERALSPLSEPSPDFEFVVRRRSRQRIDQTEGASGDAVRRRAETEVPASASAAREQFTPPASSVVEIRWFTVAPEHYEHFRKDLAAEANIESEKSTAPKEKDSVSKPSRDLLIKVTILQPER